MSAPSFGYCWIGVWDIRGANQVNAQRGLLLDAELNELPDLSAASPQYVKVLRTAMLDDAVAHDVANIEWSLHVDTNPSAGDYFVSIRAIDGDVASAKSWIDSRNGRIWRTAAISYVLLSIKMT